jgi:Holliday junction resolvase RusA-like endonuclease
MNNNALTEAFAKFVFDITPCPAPRMTRRDKIFTNPNHPNPKKRQRECVRKYFSFKNEVIWTAKSKKYVLQDELNILFFIPMPETWSQKKKDEMNLKPHKQKPDCDNLTKAWLDSFGEDDSFVWNIHAIKRWGFKGQIIVF